MTHMKAKFVLLIIAVLFVLGTFWLVNHTYVVINFFVALKIMGGILVAVVLAFLAGRWTARQ
jgi:hypothetical protein